jgi:hypothetical protein
MHPDLSYSYLLLKTYFKTIYSSFLNHLEGPYEVQELAEGAAEFKI